MRLLPILTSRAAAAALTLQFLPSSASAQQPMALPAITVQGATLETGAFRGRGPPRLPRFLPKRPAMRRLAPTQPHSAFPSRPSAMPSPSSPARSCAASRCAVRPMPCVAYRGSAVSRQGGVGNLTQVRIRGAEGNHTLVLIDGIEANNTTDGEFDFCDLSAEDIERIEVIRGPRAACTALKPWAASSMSSSQASRPVTNDGFRSSRGGAFATNDIVARLSGGNDRAWLSISAQRRRTDGFNMRSNRLLKRIVPSSTPCRFAGRRQTDGEHGPRLSRCEHGESALIAKTLR